MLQCYRCPIRIEGCVLGSRLCGAPAHKLPICRRSKCVCIQFAGEDLAGGAGERLGFGSLIVVGLKCNLRRVGRRGRVACFPLRLERDILTGGQLVARSVGLVVVLVQPLVEGLAARSGEQGAVQNGGHFIGLDHLADHIASAAVRLIGHDHIVLRNDLVGELILRLDDRSVGQLDRAVGVNDASIGDLDVFLALIRLRRVDGTGDCTLVALDFNAAVRLLGAVQRAAVAGGHDDVVLVIRRGDLVILAGQLDGAVSVLLRPLGIEGHISGEAGNFHILIQIRSAHAVLRRAPAGKGHGVGEGVEDGADGLIVSIDVDLIVAHAAVGLVDHSAVAVRHCVGQPIIRLDLAAAGQNDAAVGLDDRAAGDLDLFLAVRLVVGIGTGHGARAVIRNLDAAVRLRAGDRSAGSRLDDHIVLIVRREDLVILTGQDDGAVRAAVMDHQCAVVRGRGDGDRIAGDILCSTAVQLIGFCLITLKGRDINAVGLILADLDGLFLCQRIVVVQILDRQVILILRRGGLLIVICDFLISVPTGELDASVEAGGQLCCRAALYAGDAHQRVARLVGRGQGQTVGCGSAAAVRFIHLTGVVKHGCPAVCYSLDRNRDEVRLIVEGLFRWLGGFHRQEMGHILTGAQLVLAVQNVCRRGDGHLFAGHRIKGILIERHARLVSGAGAVLDDNGAGGLGNIHKVDLQVPGLVRHLIVLAVVIPQRPAAKALRHGLVGLAHAGLFRGDRTQIGDGVGANRAVLDCVVQSLVRFVQFGLVHCNKVHIAGLLGVADGVGCLHRKCGTISITSGAIWFERICGHVVRYKVIAKRR